MTLKAALTSVAPAQIRNGFSFLLPLGELKPYWYGCQFIEWLEIVILDLIRGEDVYRDGAVSRIETMSYYRQANFRGGNRRDIVGIRRIRNTYTRSHTR